MSANKAPDFLRSYGRRKGRPLRPHKQHLVDELLPQLAPPSPLPSGKDCWLEIGFGGGEHLHHIAKHYPEKHFIGAEPFLNGVAILLSQIDRDPVQNLSIIADDVRPWLKALPAGSLAGVYLLFPDPWPKRRHHNRRILNTALLDILAHAIKPGGSLRIATDHVDYSAWMMEHLLSHPAFTWQVKSCHDWQEPFADWQQTRYQRKTTDQGRLPVFLEFHHIPSPLGGEG